MTPTVLLTRPLDQSRAVADALRQAAGPSVRIVISPLMRIESVAANWDRAAPCYLFTSQQGVREYVRSGADPTRSTGAKQALTRAFCVGDRTAKAARAAGLQAISAGGTVEDLLQLVLNERPKGPLVHLRGRHARGDLAQRLSDAGLNAVEAIVYDQRDQDPTPEAKALISQGFPVVAPLYSPRSATRFAKEFAPAPHAHLLCMSEFVAGNLEPDAFQRIDVIAQPDGATMFESVLRILSQASHG